MPQMRLEPVAGGHVGRGAQAQLDRMRELQRDLRIGVDSVQPRGSIPRRRDFHVQRFRRGDEPHVAESVLLDSLLGDERAHS